MCRKILNEIEIVIGYNFRIRKIYKNSKFDY